MGGTVFRGARTSSHLNVVECLHIFKTKWFFNAAKWAGPWQGMLGNTAQPSTWMFLHGCITSTRNGFSAPWKELAVLEGAQPSHKFDFLWKASYRPNKNNLLDGPAINLNVFTWLHKIHTKRFFNTVKGTGPCLKGHNQAVTSNVFETLYINPDEKVFQHREMSGTVFREARPSIHLNVVESLHNIKTKWFFDAAKWAGPWQGMLGSAAQSSTWMCLNGCI